MQMSEKEAANYPVSENILSLGDYTRNIQQ